MKLRTVFIVLGCMLILFTALHCATVVRTITNINLLSDDEEMRLGQQMVAEIESKEQVVYDPQVMDYIAQHGRAVSGYLPPRSFGYTFKVVAGPEINAFVTPGGHCYVYSGLIKFADNEAGLVGVVGHECAHVAAEHIGKQLTKQFTYAVIAGAMLGDDPSTVEKIASAMLGTGVGMHFSRHDEYEADRLGVEAMINAGYHPQGMIDFSTNLTAHTEAVVGLSANTSPRIRPHQIVLRRFASRLRGIVCRRIWSWTHRSFTPSSKACRKSLH